MKSMRHMLEGIARMVALAALEQRVTREAHQTELVCAAISTLHSLQLAENEFVTANRPRAEIFPCLQIA